MVTPTSTTSSAESVVPSLSSAYSISSNSTLTLSGRVHAVTFAPVVKKPAWASDIISREHERFPRRIEAPGAWQPNTYYIPNLLLCTLEDLPRQLLAFRAHEGYPAQVLANVVVAEPGAEQPPWVLGGYVPSGTSPATSALNSHFTASGTRNHALRFLRDVRTVWGPVMEALCQVLCPPIHALGLR